MQHNEHKLLLWQDVSRHTTVPQASFYTDLQRILVKAAYFSGLKSLAVRTMEKWVTCTWHKNTQSSVNDSTWTVLVTLLPRLQVPNCRNGLDRDFLMWLSSSTDLLFNLHIRVAFLWSHMKLLKNRKAFFFPIAGRKLPEFVAKGGSGSRQHQHI